MPDEVRLEQERSSASLTLEVAVAVMHVPLMQQETLLTSEFRRAFRTPGNVYAKTDEVQAFYAALRTDTHLADSFQHNLDKLAPGRF